MMRSLRWYLNIVNNKHEKNSNGCAAYCSDIIECTGD